MIQSLITWFNSSDLMQWDFSQWVSNLNFFNDTNYFSALYQWLPGDIAGACQAIIMVSLILFVLGVIDKVIVL